jgi:hypothetical protein
LASGIEALAFYKSIHNKIKRPFRGKWGTFIFDYALAYLYQELNRFYPDQFTHSKLIEKAFWFLYFHERFHFQFDSWSISMESATGKPLYENYLNGIYRVFHPDTLVYEESLANLHALSSISRFGIHKYAKEFMLCQPGAYSNIIGIDRDECRSRLAVQLLHGNASIIGTPARQLPEHSQYLANPKDTNLFDNECPIFLIQGVSASIFVKPSISLPKLTEIEGGFLQKYLNGRKTKSDHTYYVIDNGEKVRCPNPHNKNVTLSEFMNITKKSGLTSREFFEERENTNKWRKNVPRKISRPSLIRIPE